MQFLAVFATALSSAVAFAPAQPRALASRTVARTPSAVVLKSTDDDVETGIVRAGLVAGIGVPILVAPFSGETCPPRLDLHK